MERKKATVQEGAMTTQALTLGDYGIPPEQFRPAYPLPVDEEGRPRCIVISRCPSYDDVLGVLEKLPKGPDGKPKDRIWIGNENGVIVVGKEKA